MNNDMAFDFARCVDALRDSSQCLDSTIQILDSGVRDFPRTRQVIQITRVPLPAAARARLL